MPDVIPEPFPRSNSQFIGRIRLVMGDLLRQTDVEAIVGTIPPSLNAEGTLHNAIISAAGAGVDDFILDNMYRPRPGDVFAVPPFALPVKHILYVVTPVWKDMLGNEDRDLTRCYRGIVQMAAQMRLRRIALPAVGCGSGKFPVKRVARLGVQGIIDRLTPGIEEVRVVCDREDAHDAFRAALMNKGWTP